MGADAGDTLGHLGRGRRNEFERDRGVRDVRRVDGGDARRVLVQRLPQSEPRHAFNLGAAQPCIKTTARIHDIDFVDGHVAIAGSMPASARIFATVVRPISRQSPVRKASPIFVYRAVVLPGGEVAKPSKNDGRLHEVAALSTLVWREQLAGRGQPPTFLDTTGAQCPVLSAGRVRFGFGCLRSG